MKKAIGPYENTYAPLFEWNLEQWSGDRSTASILTAIGLAGALVWNLVVLFGLLVLLFGEAWRLPDRAVSAGLALPFLVSYLLFIRNRRFEELFNRYRRQTEAEQRRVRRRAWGYILASYVLLPAILFTVAIVRGTA